jgi:hypothetical protein
MCLPNDELKDWLYAISMFIRKNIWNINIAFDNEKNFFQILDLNIDSFII